MVKNIKTPDLKPTILTKNPHLGGLLLGFKILKDEFKIYIKSMGCVCCHPKGFLSKFKLIFDFKDRFYFSSATYVFLAMILNVSIGFLCLTKVARNS